MYGTLLMYQKLLIVPKIIKSIFLGGVLKNRVLGAEHADTSLDLNNDIESIS